MQDLSPFYHLAHDFALQTNRSIFLTGKAGTGKTTFLHNLKKETRKQMAIVAPTGVAAINAGGTTMHSFFQLPFTPFFPTPEGRKELIEKIKMQGYRRKVIQELELLVIDEISMVRADVLDAVDTILRHVRYNLREPFGGVQVIFIGDMFQLSPVAKEEEWRLLSQYYQSPYFFHSQVVAQQQPVYIELDKIFRQINGDFIRVLNEIRNNQLTNEGMKLLQNCYQPGFVPPNDDTYITLTTHNYKADLINNSELQKLKGAKISFEAKITGDFPEKSFPTEQTLELKVGAKVMFIKNDNESPRRFFNGKIGVIDSIEDDEIVIQCPDDVEPIYLGKMVWENMRYHSDEKTKQIQEDVIGTFTQYPLRMAWAITIHKSQGLTFDKAVIDAGDAFAAGQVYVALSRCRSLEGMVLWSKINPVSIQNDRLIVDHERNKLPLMELEQQLDTSRNEFRYFVLKQLFDFVTEVGMASRLKRETEGVGGSFNEETLPFIDNVMKQLQELQDVAGKFQVQLQRITLVGETDENYLSDRLTAALTFFVEKTGLLSETLLQSPASTDSRENAKNYDDLLKMLFGQISQKLHIYKKLKLPFSIEEYFVLKNTFLLPEIKLTTYAKTGNYKRQVSKNPKLYFQLLTVRNQICEPEDLPIYLVAGSETLIQMSDYLPLTEKDLLQIKGFGPAKVQKFGQQFLTVIQEYCKNENLVSQMPEKSKAKTEKKKKEKGESNRITFNMFNDGKSIKEIAKERNLATSTICGHLAGYIRTGQVDIYQLIPRDKFDKAMDVAQGFEDYSTLNQNLSTFMENFEVQLFISYFRTR